MAGDYAASGTELLAIALIAGQQSADAHLVVAGDHEASRLCARDDWKMPYE